MTTEFNTLFETITSISEKVDPVKLNMTLTATAQALTGWATSSASRSSNGNAILDDINPQMPQIRHDIQAVGGSRRDVYTNASPDLWNASATTR